MGTERMKEKTITLQNFCDMDQLFRLLDNWSQSCGMATMIVDSEGNRLSEDFGMTEFCRMVQSYDEGLACCMEIWKEDLGQVYECPFGFSDFSIPIVLPDGQVLGKVLAGQALSVNQSEDEIIHKVTPLGIDEETVREVLSHVHRKTDREMQGAYELLKETLHFFIQNSYSVYKTKNELKRAPEKKDRVLSQITRIMYSYNLTIDLDTGNYTLTTGTGMTKTVDEYKKHDNFSELREFHEECIHPAYIGRFNEFTDFETARKNPKENGYRGAFEYPVLYPGTVEYEWHEINVLIDTEEDGSRVANILGRDITEAHKAQEKSENERRSAAAKNQILSELTKMLYSYNLTLNLRTGKYSMIIGTGMTQFMEIFKSTDDYETAYNRKISYLDPEYVQQFSAIAGLDALRARTNANGFIGSLEYRAFTDYGMEWHEINVFISTDETGDPVANILGRDITESHKRQEQRDNQQRAATARDQMLSGVTKMLYGYNVTVNLETWKYSIIAGTGMEHIVEVMQQDDDYVLLNAKLSKNIAPEDADKVDGLISVRALREKTGATGYIGSVTYRSSSNGQERWAEANLFIRTNEDGVPLANILGRDVTEVHEQQERRENELKAIAARDQLLSGITKMLYSFNMSVNVNTGRYTLITGTGLDDAVAAMKLTDRFDVVYKKFMTEVDSSYRQRAMELLDLDNYRKHIEKTGFLGTEEFPMHRNETLEWHEINVFAGYDENGEAIINILGRDMSEAHEKADTKAQLEIANASSAAKSAFLFNMSHDIRTPMNAIIGFTELLEKHIDDREQALSYIKKIQTSNGFLLSLINNVLEMARIESGKATQDETYCDVHEFNDTLFSLFDSQMKEKGIEFTRTKNIIHPHVLCDETKLKEIFLNILSNALKYTPSGGKVSMNLTELPSDRLEYAVYQTVIEDTGIGMSEEYLPHLFEEFSRERSSTETKLNGTGLGMSIVKKLVDLMEGTIEVASCVGKGTRITVTLPHRIAQEGDARALADKAHSYNTETFRGKRILLAEDNELNAEIAITILEEAGFVVEHAEDGIICVDMMEKAEAGYYDLILMDIQMPNMDGYKATRTIRKLSDPDKAGITIVAVTANAFEEDKQNAYEAGMNRHIAKPIKIEELMAALAEVL
ncbi:MAG: ATP-binding protein [Firmicutes bacterium]|nr:ATP-binding protein [Bacillota bacterium]